MIDDAKIAAAFKALTGHKPRKKAKATSAAGLKRLEAALCTLADYEGEISDVMPAGSQGSIGNVCDGLRKLVDGDEES